MGKSPRLLEIESEIQTKWNHSYVSLFPYVPGDVDPGPTVSLDGSFTILCLESILEAMKKVREEQVT